MVKYSVIFTADQYFTRDDLFCAPRSSTHIYTMARTYFVVVSYLILQLGANDDEGARNEEKKIERKRKKG